MGELTEKQVEQLVTDIMAEQQFLDRNKLWQEQRKLVYQDRPVVIPGVTMEVEFRTPDLLDAADKFAARFLGAPVTINVSAQGSGPKAHKAAQNMENYDYRFVNRLLSSGVLDGPIHDMCGVTGEAWVHMTLNRAVLPIIPEREKGEDDEAYLKRAKPILDEFSKGERADLIVVEPVREPETIYYTPDMGTVFMAADVPLAPLQREYGQKGAGGYWGKKGESKHIAKQGNGLFKVTSLEGAVAWDSFDGNLYTETVRLYIVEDGEYIYHLVDSGDEKRSKIPLGCYKNVFGMPGFQRAQARKTNHPSAKYAVHPLTHKAIAVAPLYNITGTIVYSGGVLGELQRVMLEELPGQEAADARKANKTLEIELIGQRVIKAPDGYKLVQPNIGVNADTLESMNRLERLMVEGGYPPELGNPSDVDASSGYQQATMRDTVANVVDPPLKNIAALINTLLSMKDNAIKTLGIPVTFRNYAPTDEVGGVSRNVMSEITIDPDDIIEVDRVVKFDSLTQYARQAMVEMGRALLAEGRITEDMFLREHLGIDDPERLKRQRIIEKAEAIADDHAVKTAAALMQRTAQFVAAEATVDAGMAPFVTPDPSQAPDPMGGVYTQNGVGGSVPLEPSPMEQAEMGQVGSYGA